MEEVKINNLLINSRSSIKEAMKIIDRGRLGIAFVVDRKNKIIGSITDGDIRGAILKGIDIGKRAEEIANKNFIFLKEGFKKQDILDLRQRKEVKKNIAIGGSLKAPILDKNGKIKDLAFVYPNKVSFLKSLKAYPDAVFVKKVLVVGGAGYLGSKLCLTLLDNRYRVRVLDNLTYGDSGIKDFYSNKNFELVKGDIRNISDIVEAVQGVDAVIHLAAIVGDPASQINPRKTIEINYLASKAIAEICKFNQINKFLFASTCSVYGASKDPDKELKETSFLNPISLYAKTKLKSEEAIMDLADENFSPTIFRFATLCGVSLRMRFDLVVNLLTAKALKERKITIFGGNQWRPNLEVSDAALACLKWIELPIEQTGAEIINIGGKSQNYRIIDIGRMIKKIVPKAKLEIYKKAEDLRNYNVCFEKAKNQLGFVPTYPIKKAVAEIKRFIEKSEKKNFSGSKYDNYKFWMNHKES